MESRYIRICVFKEYSVMINVIQIFIRARTSEYDVPRIQVCECLSVIALQVMSVCTCTIYYNRSSIIFFIYNL